MLQRYGRHSPVLFELRDWYLEELRVAGQKHYGTQPWGYSFYSNGKPIRNEERRLYRPAGFDGGVPQTCNCRAW